MKVTLSQIEAFHWIASLGSFHAAAERLRVAQPTISVRIRALERLIGTRLFERKGRRIRVTPAGLELAEKAERILSIAGEISDSGPGLGDRLRPPLRLGAPDGFAMVCLPLMLQLMEKEDPELKMALTIENSAVLNQQVNVGNWISPSSPTRSSAPISTPSISGTRTSPGSRVRECNCRIGPCARPIWRCAKSSLTPSRRD